MTQTFATNQNNDIYIAGNGNLAIVSSLEAVMKACETACLAQLGEMLLSVNQGIPNFQAVWVGTPNYALLQSYLRRTILSVDGVSSVSSLTLSVKDNILSYTAEILTIYGTAQING